MYSSKTHNTKSSGSNQSHSAFFQPKLSINQPNDIYEQEADAVADKVMRMQDTSSEKKFFSPPVIQRKCADCEKEEEEKKLQKKNDDSNIIIQRQDGNGEQQQQPRSSPALLPPLRLTPPFDSVDYLGLQQTFFNRGLMFPGSYMDSAQQEWGRQYQFYSRFGLGNVVGNSFMGDTLKFFGVTPPAGDWNAWLANTTTPMAVDSALSHDFPTMNEQEERRGGLPAPTIINAPAIHFKKEKGHEHDADVNEVIDASSNNIQKKCADCKEEEKLQRKESNDQPSIASSQTENYINNLSGGKPLDGAEKNFFESRMGYDFSDVKIHNDNSANQSAKNVNALAYTHGNNIVFNSGQYQQHTDEGKKLLAHELTHVVQQSSFIQNKPIQRKSTTNQNHIDGISSAQTANPEENNSNEKSDLKQVNIYLKIAAAASDDPDKKGNYPPLTNEGKYLIAHESTQVMQQSNGIQRQETATAADAASTVYDALDGWTSSSDSATIRDTLRTQGKASTDQILTEVARLAGMQINEVIDWMKSDMVSSDWEIVLGHLIDVQANNVERAIASQIQSLLSGYTSDSDSTAILGYFTGTHTLQGDLLTRTLQQLESVSGNSQSAMADWLFGDMTSLNADHLAQYFFTASSVDAYQYAAHFYAAKIKDLIAGYTSVQDSASIVANFRRVQQVEARMAVLYELNYLCMEEWSEPASDSLMKDMQQEDYEQLRVLMPEMLPIYNIQRNFLGWLWDKITVGFDYVEAFAEYVVCGIIGVVIGILSIITDIIGAVIDIAVAAKDLVGLVIYYISGGRLCRENYDRVQQFFTGIGQLFHAPGEAISRMWHELTEESSLIEGPFQACQQSIFWVRRVTNLIVNIILVFVAGYGAVKLALEGIETIVTLARTGRLASALARLPARLFEAIKNLPAATASRIASGVQRFANLLRNPARIIASVRTTLTAIRMVAQDEGYFSFVRRQAGRVLENEAEFWRDRRSFWQARADTIGASTDGVESTLAGAVEVAAEDPVAAEGIVTEAETQATTAQNNSGQVMNEINGTTAETPATTEPPVVETPPESIPDEVPPETTPEPVSEEPVSSPATEPPPEPAVSVPRSWDDPDLTFEEFKQQYRNAVDRGLSDEELEGYFQDGYRFNPETKRMSRPVRPVEGTPRAGLPAEGTSSFEAWENFRFNDPHNLPCFIKGTKIKTKTSYINIEELEDGMEVWCYDFQRKTSVLSKVNKTYKNWTDVIVKIILPGGTIQTTLSHPFWCASENKWLPAALLQPDMLLQNVEGIVIPVMNIENMNALANTYNFETEIYHNYFVGEDNVLVHNDERVSAFASTDVFSSDIYVLSHNGNVVYVGQTIDGVDVRIARHVRDENSAVFQYLRNQGIDPLAADFNYRNVFQIENPIHGSYTHYEITVWEQHYIDFYRAQPGNILQNRINAITEDKYIMYHNLHNPCR